MARFCTNCGFALSDEAHFCTKCGAKTGNVDPGSTEHRKVFSDKRQKILNNKKTKNNKGLIYLALTIFGVLGFMAFFNSLPSFANPIIDQQPIVSPNFSYPNSPLRMVSAKATVRDGKIIIPLDQLKKNKLLKFKYKTEIKTLPLLAYISEEGKVITAVSVCEPCKSTTFHIKGEQLICNSCGTTWDIDNLSGVSGSCQKYPPDPLPSTVIGNEVRIDEATVASWKSRI